MMTNTFQAAMDTRPTTALQCGDTEIPLEYPCTVCNGVVKDCRHCKGKGVVPSADLVRLMAVLRRHFG